MAEQDLLSDFPLYDHLYEKVSKLIDEDTRNSDIQMKEVDELLSGVRKLNYVALQTLFMLVRIHSLRHSEDKLFDVPYAGKKVNVSKEDENKCDIKFDIREFPPMLRKILLEFVRLNNKKESEEEEFRFTPKKLK
jgi:hypothetical protein